MRTALAHDACTAAHVQYVPVLCILVEFVIDFFPLSLGWQEEERANSSSFSHSTQIVPSKILVSFGNSGIVGPLCGVLFFLNAIHVERPCLDALLMRFSESLLAWTVCHWVMRVKILRMRLKGLNYIVAVVAWLDIHKNLGSIIFSWIFGKN